MLEPGLPAPGFIRLGEPHLDTPHPRRLAFLCVGDPAPGGHEVQLARTDQLLGAERVAVQCLPFEQPGHRREADVRVGPDLHRLGVVEVGRSHAIDETPRTDGSAPLGG